MRFRFSVQDRCREKSEIGDGARNIEHARERNRLASIDRLCARELLDIAFDQLRDAQKNFGALRRRSFRPIGKRLLACSDRKIDIARVAIRDLRMRFTGRRLDVVEIATPDRLDEFAIDEVADSLKLCVHEIRKKLSFVAARATIGNS